MLVKCPRCDFSQPKDQYCAQCGIDMQSFKPPRKSVLKSYLTDPLLYLAIALIIVGVSIATLYKKDKSNLAQRVSFLKGNVQIASTNGLDKKSSMETAVARLEAEVPSASPPKDTAPEVETTRRMASVETASPSAAAATKPAAAINGPVVRVYYAEVPRHALERLYAESQATGQFNSFGDYTAGILPDVAKRISAPSLKILVLEKAEKSITKAVQLFAGVHDHELEDVIGLSTYIELAEIENNSFRGNIEVIRSLRENGERASGSIQKNSYPAIFELGPGAGFFIAGVLPHGQLPHEEQLVKQGPFRILKSPSFQNKESEFVIFIEFEKKP